jgi:bifunctional aspartokinase / homoserine dehydrogenase 1
LSYIFSLVGSGASFSQAVSQAREKGFTEPDPREDLSGRDVGRKMVCLAREMGMSVSMEDLTCVNLVPKPLRSCPVDEFLEKLPEYDQQVGEQLASIKNEKACLAYAGHIDENSTIHVGLKAFASAHPFAKLAGADNMVVFTTQRYLDQPLIIRGPGAGAAVTAAGIFADLLRLVSYIG